MSYIMTILSDNIIHIVAPEGWSEAKRGKPGGFGGAVPPHT